MKVQQVNEKDPSRCSNSVAGDGTVRRRCGGRTLGVRWGVLVAGALVATVAMDPVVTVAALLTGVFNTAGGGGAIITFVALSATGVPALTAHVTSQVVTPVSFLGGVGLVREYWPGWQTVMAGCVGAVGGVWVLAITPPETFQAVAPWCLVPAAVLVVAQGKMRTIVARRRRGLGAPVTVLATVACGLYAGMIGVGTGTLAVAVLGLAPVFLGMSLPTLVRTRNVLLLGMALVVSGAFALSGGLVDWALVARLVPAAAIGGWLGTKLVGRLPAPALQSVIVVTALGGAIWMILQGK